MLYTCTRLSASHTPQAHNQLVRLWRVSQCHVLQADVYEVTRNLTYPVPLLDLPVHCMYGYGVATDEAYLYDVEHFDSSAPPEPEKTQHGDGDGTVNLASLQACSK